MTPSRPWWPRKGFGDVQSSCKYYLYGQELKRTVCLVATIVGTQSLVSIHSAWGPRRGWLFLFWHQDPFSSARTPTSVQAAPLAVPPLAQLLMGAEPQQLSRHLLLNSQAVLLGCHSEPLAKFRSCQTIKSSGPCPV